jgi:hypothetical protein
MSEVPWPNELKVRPQDGLSLVLLLKIPEQWIFRRVESVSFVDDSTIRRRVSVDFAPPRDVIPALQMGSETVNVVPLALLKKEPLRNFDLWDESGKRLSLLTASQNAELSGAALLQYAEFVLATTPPPLVANDLRDIAGPDQDISNAAVERMRAASDSASGVRKQLVQHGAFKGLMEDLLDNFLLLVPVDTGPSRRVIKFAYDEPFELFPDRTAWDRWVQSLSWSDTAIAFQVPAITNTASYHFELKPPLGLDAETTLVQFAGDEIIELASEGRGHPETHLHVSGVETGRQNEVLVLLRAQYQGWLRIAAASVVFTAFVLGLGRWRLGAVIDSNIAGSAASLLVAIPGVLTAVLARPGEHALAARLLFAIRVAVLASSVCAYAAAASLLVGLSRETLFNTWWVLFGIAGGGAASVAFAFVRSLHGAAVPAD